MCQWAEDEPSPTQNHTIPSPPAGAWPGVSGRRRIELPEWPPPRLRPTGPPARRATRRRHGPAPGHRRRRRDAVLRLRRRPRFAPPTPRSTSAFDGYPHAIHYALKANSALAIVRLLHALGAHADANSLGEVDVATALRLPARPDRLHRRRQERRRDRSRGVARPAGHQRRVARRARSHRPARRRAGHGGPRRAARQPRHRRQEPSAHLHRPASRTSSACRSTRRRRCFARWPARQGLAPVGAHVHIGSQITTLEPLTRAAEAVVALAQALRDEGIDLQHLDMGGGLGISYDGAPVVESGRLRPRPGRRDPGQRPQDCHRARAACWSARRRAADDGRRREAVSRRQALRRGRRRHDRADAAGALQRVSSHRAGRAARRRAGSRRRRRADLREHRRVRARPPAGAGRGRRPAGGARRRRLRRRHGPHLSAPAAVARSDGRTAASGA